MNRQDWKIAYRAARMGKPSALDKYGIRTRLDALYGRVIGPAIIRDRSPQCRMADELAWSAYYRQSARRNLRLAYTATLARRHCDAVRSILADCRAIRSEISAFHRLP